MSSFYKGSEDTNSSPRLGDTPGALATKPSPQSQEEQ